MSIARLALRQHVKIVAPCIPTTASFARAFPALPLCASRTRANLVAPCTVAARPPRRGFLSPPGSKSAIIGTQPTPDGQGTIPVVLVADAKKIWKEVRCDWCPHTALQ